MKNFIPVVIEPYPDELLFSWVNRLAKSNGLSLVQFFTAYFGEHNLAKGESVPIDIRRGYLDFFKALDCGDEVDAMDLYFQLSTAHFELSFYPPKQQLRPLHNILRPENGLNTPTPYFITKQRVCLECMREDEEKYGEYYIHRSHHLSGVAACHKHGTPLYEVHKQSKEKNVYDFSKLTAIRNVTTEDVQYAKYAHCLLTNNIMSMSDNILDIILQEMNPDGELTRIQIAKDIADILGDPTKQNKWERKHVIFQPYDAIRVLMHVIPNPEDFINRLKLYKMIVKKHCKECNKDYYTTQYAIDTGWRCPSCDSLLSEADLFERLVSVAGNNEYEVKTPFVGLGNNVILYHKACDKDFKVMPGRFLFLQTRCKCNQKLLRKEAEKKMKQYPEFKLLEFNGTASPASFLHTTCGETFRLAMFRDFIENPKCRCCELPQDITQEEFEKRVKDLVDDEYTVIGEVKTLIDRVEMRHNPCGHVQEFKPHEFLSGSRCPQCYKKTSRQKLNVMLQDYADDRYSIIGHDNYRFILLDNETGKEIKLKACHIIQEMLRPTPSIVLPTDKEHNISQSLTTWDRWYQLCVEYKNKYGHLDIGGSEKYNGHALGDWCSEQRMSYNKGELSQDKIQLLIDVGFIFNHALYAWRKRFDEYKAYVEETGDYFPKTQCIHNGNKVGQWFLGQRKERKRGRLNPIYESILLDYCPTIFNERRTRYIKK